jgi:hypothetical protein
LHLSSSSFGRNSSSIELLLSFERFDEASSLLVMEYVADSAKAVFAFMKRTLASGKFPVIPDHAAFYTSFALVTIFIFLV